MNFLTTERFLSQIRKHGGFCILDTKGVSITYSKLVEIVDNNLNTLERLGLKNNRQVCIFDISLGGRAIPVILALLSAHITVVPIDRVNNPLQADYICGQFSAGALLIDTTHIDEQGRIIIEPELGERGAFEQLDDVAFVLYTSGTTGRPRGVMLTYDNIWSNVEDILAYFPIHKEDRFLIIRPLTHASAIIGELLPALICGCSIIIKPVEQSPFMACALIERFSATLLCTTPTVSTRLIPLLRRYDTASLRLLVLSGESLYEKQKQKIINAYQNEIWNVYGLTEASPRVSCLKGLASDASCVGKALNKVRVKVVDDSGKVMQDGHSGELLLSGPNIMKGYFGDIEATRNKTTDGWLYTGDYATVRNGIIFIHGRKDGMLIRSGINVFPCEIEQLMLDYPGVHEALVFGKRNEQQELKICAWIIADPGVLPKHIFQHLIDLSVDSRLWPDVIENKRSFAQTTSGKLMRPLP